MARKWTDRPKDERWMIIGAFVGMIIAGFVAFNYAFESGMIVRYFIMVAGLLVGLGVGKWAGSR